MKYILSYSTTLQAFKIELLNDREPSRYYKEVTRFSNINNLKMFMREYVLNCEQMVLDAKQVLKAKI